MGLNKKDAIFRMTGIIGLISLLLMFFWIKNRTQPVTHEEAEGHDHANPAQHGDIAGKKLNNDDSGKKPSGEIIAGKRTVNYEAFRYAFSPDPLVVQGGETVVLKLKSRDVEHGMMIPEIDFNSTIPAKGIKTVSFKAPTAPGKYPIFCSVYCGSGHGNMKGTLLVLPAPRQGE